MDIDDAVKRKERLEPMRAAFRAIIEKRKTNASRIPDLAGRLERLKRVRESAVGDTGLRDRAMENLEANGFRVRRAGDAAEAVAGSRYGVAVKDILEVVAESIAT